MEEKIIVLNGETIKGMSCCGMKAENYIYDEGSKINKIEKRNTSKEKEKENKKFPYKKLNRRYKNDRHKEKLR